MGYLERGLLLYLLLALAITFAYPQVVFTGQAGETVLQWFDVSYNSSTDTVSVGSAMSSSATNATADLAIAPDTSGTGFLYLFDPIFQVLSWFLLIFAILFSPIMLLGSGNPGMAGAPTAVVFMIGLPLVLLMVIALIKFFRGVD